MAKLAQVAVPKGLLRRRQSSLDPQLPTPGQYDVELVLQGNAPPEQMLETAQAVVNASWQSGKCLYVDTDLKIDLPQATLVLDRERLADLGLDLAQAAQELDTLIGGNYLNRFNFFDRSYKVIPQIGDEDRATVGPLLDLEIKTPSGELAPVSTFTHIETSTAPRALNRFQQRNAVRVFGGVKPGVPLVLVYGPGAEARNSIGTILVAGMIVGTLFTLFVVPVGRATRQRRTADLGLRLRARDRQGGAGGREPRAGCQPPGGGELPGPGEEGRLSHPRRGGC